MMAHDGDTLAEDWLALWQSEIAAMAADRELRESWIGLLAVWANASAAALDIEQRHQAHDYTWSPTDQPASGFAGTAQSAGTTPVTAASNVGSDEARRLNERVTALEFRLSAFERRGRKLNRPTSP